MNEWTYVHSPLFRRITSKTKSKLNLTFLKISVIIYLEIQKGDFNG